MKKVLYVVFLFTLSLNSQNILDEKERARVVNEILKDRFENLLPKLMDRADYALKLMAEGKINLGVGNKNLEIEQMKLKNFRNNIVISFFGIVIVFLLVF